MKKSSKLTQGDGWTLVKTCPRCGRAEAECRCQAAAPAAAAKPAFRLRLEKRSGKIVTVLDAAGLAGEALQALARELKGSCAAGGTVKGGAIELQGDQLEKLRGLLAKKGLAVKG